MPVSNSSLIRPRATPALSTLPAALPAVAVVQPPAPLPALFTDGFDGRPAIASASYADTGAASGAPKKAPSLARVAQGDAVMETGEHGQHVRQLQTLLNQVFENKHVQVNGTYGAALTRTVTTFQKNHHLSATGNVNKGTLAAIRKEAGTGRSAKEYAQVLAQINPRSAKYMPHSGSTFCNVFAEDVTAKMGAPLPRLMANDLYNWLGSSAGKNAGWHQVSAAEAQKAANAGDPTVAVYHNNTGVHGHIAMVRPGHMAGPGNPAIAQAGAENFLNGHKTDGFGSLPVKYYTHD